MTTLRPTRLLPFLAIAALAIAACSTGTSSSAPTASSAASAPAASAPAEAGDVCTDAAAVESSLIALKDLDLKAVGKNGLDAAVTEVRTAVANLAESAKDEVGAEAQALTTSLEDLEATVSGLADDATVAAKVAEVQAAVTDVRDAATNLKAALTSCQ